MKIVLALGCALLVAACSQSTPTTVPDATPTTSNSTATASSPSEPVSAKPDYQDRGKQAAWINRGKDAIRAKLRDPDSAQFRNVEFHSGGGVPLACGEVNANNGFGGKAGYERFIAAGETMTVLESEMTSPSELDTVWNKFCVG